MLVYDFIKPLVQKMFKNRQFRAFPLLAGYDRFKVKTCSICETVALRAGLKITSVKLKAALSDRHINRQESFCKR